MSLSMSSPVEVNVNDDDLLVVEGNQDEEVEDSSNVVPTLASAHDAMRLFYPEERQMETAPSEEFEKAMEIHLSFADVAFDLPIKPTTTTTSTPLCCCFRRCRQQKQPSAATSTTTMAKRKTILHPVSGSVPPGTILAIMGPSGCGKSSLLDILSGRKTTPWRGSVLYNGHPADDWTSRFVSYVSQGDLLCATLTVREELMFVSHLKADYSYLNDGDNNDDEDPIIRRVAKLREHHVDMLLRVLGLWHVRDSLIGGEKKRGISGGQRRRLTLAKGLVTGPSLLFGDEITSGLSATDSLLALRALRSMAAAFKMSFALVIHQPRIEVFWMFSSVLCFSYNGHAVYQGEPSLLVEYLSTAGFPRKPDEEAALPDRLLDLASANEPSAALLRTYESQIAPGVNEKIKHLPAGRSTRSIVLEHSKFFAQPHTPGSSSPFIAQLRSLQSRDWRQAVRDTEFLVVNYASSAIIGVVLGLAFFQTRSTNNVFAQSSFLFMASLTSALFSFNYLPTVISEKAMYAAECHGEKLYGSWAYSLSKAIISLFSSLSTIFLFSILAYFIAGFEARRYVYFLVVQALGFLAIDSLLAVVSASVNDHESANTLAAFLLTILSLFNGFTSNEEIMPVWVFWIQYASPFFYTFSSLASAFFLASDVPAEHRITDAQAKSLSLDAKMEWLGPVVLVAYVLVFRCIAVLVMHVTKGGVAK